MESSSIYEDLNDLSIGDKLIKAQEENKKLLQHIETLEGDIRKLCKELTQMKVKESNLKKNISELFNTATMETNRKQKMINDLQNRLDDLQFRRSRVRVNNFNSHKRNRDDDVVIIEPKKAKIDFSERDKYSSRENVRDSRSRSSSKDENLPDSSHREKHNQYYTQSRESTKDKYNTHRSSESHRHSSTKSNVKEYPPTDKNNHHPKLKLNNSYFNTDIKIEVKNNERVISHVGDLKKTTEKSTKNDVELKPVKKEIDDIKCAVKIKTANGEKNKTTLQAKNDPDLKNVEKTTSLQVKKEIDEDIKNVEKTKTVYQKQETADTLKDSKKNNETYIKTERIITTPKLEEDETIDCDISDQKPEPNPQKTEIPKTTSANNSNENSTEKAKKTASKQNVERVKKLKTNEPKKKINSNMPKAKVKADNNLQSIKNETILCEPKTEKKEQTTLVDEKTTVDLKEKLKLETKDVCNSISNDLVSNGAHNNPTNTCVGSASSIKTDFGQENGKVLDLNVGEKKLTVSASSSRRRRCVIKMN